MNDMRIDKHLNHAFTNLLSARMKGTQYKIISCR